MLSGAIQEIEKLLSLHLGVVAIEKGALTKLTNFTYTYVGQVWVDLHLNLKLKKIKDSLSLHFDHISYFIYMQSE